jgi:hypothetical protein
MIAQFDGVCSRRRSSLPPKKPSLGLEGGDGALT